MGRPDEHVIRECRALLAKGSKSFSAASRLLPSRLRDPVAAYYAFCRVSDDAVDESEAPAEALRSLHARVDAIFRGSPGEHPADRGLAWLAEDYALPRAPVDALLEGYAWDVEARRYETLSEVRAYGARVAASVGVAMTWLMGPRDPRILARAADLGVAMQLTNIARDVGEDARNGRLYLPTEWLLAEGVAPDDFLARPAFSPAIGVAVCRLLDHAQLLYARAEGGVGALPPDCRTAIAAAGAIYADIGRVIRTREYDSVSARAFTTTGRKVALLARALPARAAIPRLGEPPLPEVAFLWGG